VYEEIVKRHRPKGWRIRYSKTFDKRAAEYKVELQTKKRLGNSFPDLAHSMTFTDNSKVITIPRIIDEFTLQIALHEFGHVALGHLRDNPPKLASHKEEWEAERWSINVMRTEGIAITKEITRSMRRYLRRLVKQDTAKGKPIHPPVKKFVERTNV